MNLLNIVTLSRKMIFVKLLLLANTTVVNPHKVVP